MRLVCLVLASMTVAACGESAVEERRGSTAPRAAQGGTIHIGGETWTILPNIQCSVFPGNLVAIAGNAAEDPDIEIVIDHDAERGPVGVRVEKADGRPSWSAGRDDLEFTIEGRSVSGVGTFTEFGRRVEGRFQVDC